MSGRIKRCASGTHGLKRACTGGLTRKCGTTTCCKTSFGQCVDLVNVFFSGSFTAHGAAWIDLPATTDPDDLDESDADYKIDMSGSFYFSQIVSPVPGGDCLARAPIMTNSDVPTSDLYTTDLSGTLFAKNCHIGGVALTNQTQSASLSSNYTTEAGIEADITAYLKGSPVNGPAALFNSSIASRTMTIDLPDGTHGTGAAITQVGTGSGSGLSWSGFGISGNPIHPPNVNIGFASGSITLVMGGNYCCRNASTNTCVSNSKLQTTRDCLLSP